MHDNKLNSIQENYIENICNPKYASDLVLALQNPVSPAYKKLMNQILLGEEIHLITDLLIERFLCQQYKASQHEKDLIFREWLVKAAFAEEKAKRIYVPQVLIDRESVSKLDKSDFSSRLDNRVLLIGQLEQQHDHLQQKLVNLQREGEDNSQAWNALQEKRVDDFTAILKDEEINFINADGNVLEADSFKASQIVNQAFQSPAPLTVLEKIGASWQAFSEISLPESSQAESDNIPPPPPLPALPPGFSNPALMAGMSNVVTELKLISMLCRSNENPATLMKVLKENKQALNHLPGTKLTLRPASGQKSCLEETQESQICGKAINLYQESFAIKQACHQVDLQLVHERQLQKEEIKLFRQHIGEDYAGKKPQSPKPKS